MSVRADRGVFTFYSYKGGTGRSMLLANVAWILASSGRRVLAIDWDLEAPGLHRYFQPFLVDKDQTASEGVIDFVVDFSVAAVRHSGQTDDVTWFHPYAEITGYIAPLEWDFAGGVLDFMGAGRQGPGYSTRVNAFNWGDFYQRFGGGAFLQRARELMVQRYEYVLIDSRTGVSDTSGICTVQMPDALVVCFTLNNQSIDGAASVATSVRSQRPDMRVLPVPMRIETGEKDKLNVRRQYAMDRFGELFEGRDANARERSWDDVEVQYVPFYAYEEILAVFKDRPGASRTVLAAAERVAVRLTGDPEMRAARISETRRQWVLASYAGAGAPSVLDEEVPEAVAPSGSGVYISYRRADAAAHAGRLFDRLASVIGDGSVFADVVLQPGVDFVDAVESAVSEAAVVLVVIGPRWATVQDESGRRRLADPYDFVRREVAAALARPDTRVIPVLVEGAVMPDASTLPPELAGLTRRQAIEISEERWRYDSDRLVAAVELALRPSRTAPSVRRPQRPEQVSESSERVIGDLLERRTPWRRRLVALVPAIGAAAATFVLLDWLFGRL